ncbi:MAG: hypothetical protein ABIR33_09855 [Pyrinomonadaceae bacterium]
MQQDKTPTPDVGDLDQNIDPGASKEVPLPPDVKDRETIEEPEPTPPKVEEPDEPAPRPLL